MGKRRFTAEDRIKIVELYIRNGIGYGPISKKYDVPETTLCHWVRKYNEKGAEGLLDSLTDIIRTSPSGRLIGSGNILLIDGRQPICFLKSRLNQSSIPLGSKISGLHDCSKARRRFADGLSALPKAVTQH